MTKKFRKLDILLFAGLLLIAAALFLTLWNVVQNYVAASRVHSTMEVLAETLPSETPVPDAPLPDYYLNPLLEMPTMEINGISYIGVLMIPELELELPIISEWNYPRLQVAPCRYAGSAYQDDLVIAGHNYDAHFGRLRHLKPGDAVIFMDIDGNQFFYQVAEQLVLEPTAIEEMLSDEWDMTLFTCTFGGATRITVRCERLSDR